MNNPYKDVVDRRIICGYIQGKHEVAENVKKFVENGDVEGLKNYIKSQLEVKVQP